MMDPLRALLAPLLFSKRPGDEVAVVVAAAGERDPLAHAWAKTIAPYQMVRVWQQLRGNKPTCEAFSPPLVSFLSDFGVEWAPRLEARSREQGWYFEASRIPGERERLQKATDGLCRGNANAAVWIGDLSLAEAEALSDRIRESVEAPGTFADIEALYKEAADKEAAEQAAIRAPLEAADKAPFDLGPGPWRSVAQTFEHRYGVPLTLFVPEQVRVLNCRVKDGVTWHEQVTTSRLDGLSPLADRKMGHVTCGFWGHGVNSNYFEYICRLPGATVWMTLHTGGAYSDNAACDAEVRALVTWLGAILELARECGAECEITYDSSTSKPGVCKLRGPDGAPFTSEVFPEEDRAIAIAFLRSFMR